MSPKEIGQHELHRCPSWCVEDCGPDRDDAHRCAPVRLGVPGEQGGRASPSILTAYIAWLHEDEDGADGRRPEVWVLSDAGSAELSLEQFDDHIRDVESHALRLRALRTRYAAVLMGAEAETGKPGVADARAVRMPSRSLARHGSASVRPGCACAEGGSGQAG
ncbi:hypothetical protein [Streptomyces sp. BPTC-684]|uniref:DUF6907 domain-containing protein n=1 Tax=Streptomyces sp. BPTC-684 TaxID=3043734 RepID=UPI0024B11037|nr:hypothetical protein [Streptomyces sp. BPTC-684]WHM36003.1 hypothetical protein QIY60_03105 [Streptomyces sp. BPTC-684]